jgi:hypothetical protein
MKTRIYRNLLLGITFLVAAMTGLAQSGNVPKPAENAKEEVQKDTAPQKKDTYTDEQRSARVRR